MVDKMAELRVALEGLSIDKLRLLLHFANFLANSACWKG